MSDSKVDILILGATGYTGSLIVEYLAHHSLRKRFTFGLAARSAKKLEELKKSLDLSSDVPTFVFNISAYEEVNHTIQHGKVVINCIGPFWRVSTPIVQACAVNGVDYLDISGEAWWIKELIEKFDYLAAKNKTIIIPACGHDSVPSDMAVYLSARTASKKLGPNIELGPSLTAIQFSGAASGGTLATVLSVYDSLPRHKLEGIHDPYMLAPVKGIHRPFQLVYSLPFTKLHGGISIMGSINTKIVNRTWGLLEARAKSSGSASVEPIRYGSHFSYDEFSVQGSRFMGGLFTFIFMISMALVAFCPPLRWILKTFGPQPGTGPKETDKNFVRYTNVTTTYAPRSNRRSIKSALLFRGGVYSSSAVIIGEAALTILLHRAKLPSLGREGGVLTTITALGEPYLQRLLDSELVTYDSEVIGNDRATH